jgi:SAM-dependent methyltransferase
MSASSQPAIAGGDPRRVFIATSAEALDSGWCVDAIDKANKSVGKSHPDIELMPWDGVFKTGDVTALELIEQAAKVVGAVVVLSADDFTTSRGSKQSAPRDNLVLEAGIFISRLGLPNVLLLRENDSKWPSDLLGVTTKTFDRPPSGRQGASSITANSIALAIKQFVADLPCPATAPTELALGRSSERMLRQAEDLRKRLESPPAESAISIPDPLYAYLDALGQVNSEFATTTYLESGFWTSRDVEILEANRTMLKRIKKASGTARRLILIGQPMGDELAAQRRRRRLLRSGDPGAVKSMNVEWNDFASAHLDLIGQGFQVKVVYDRDDHGRSLPKVISESDAELALYDADRVDKFSGFVAKERAQVDVYDAHTYRPFSALREKASAYFETLWQSGDAEDFSVFADEMHTMIDEVEREIDYTPNWLALYDRSVGNDGDLKREETNIVRAWLEKRHGKFTEIAASHIDIGTCTGRYLKELEQCVRKSGTSVGIDIDPDCVQLVELKLESSELGSSEVKEGDIRRRDELPTTRFDIVTCMMGTLCHLGRSAVDSGGRYGDEWQTGLENISSLLAEDGDAFLAVWDAGACKRAKTVLDIYDQRSSAILCRQSPTRAELQARLKQAGLGIEREKPIKGRLRVLHVRQLKG